jgi:hypothetical protein
MTRDEARKLLEGTWSFTKSGNSVLVRETGLLQEIAGLAGTAKSQAPLQAGNHRMTLTAPFYLATG